MSTQVKKGQIDADIIAGWIPALESWSYKSATEIYVAGDQTGKYQKGDKVKFTQTTVKYAYIVAVSAYDAGNTRTTLTITGGTDYTVANAAISAQYYSKNANPQGFPHAFNYTPTWTASTTNPVINNGTLKGAFSVVGNEVRFFISLTVGSTTTTGTGTYAYILPLNAGSLIGSAIVVSIVDSGAAIRNAVGRIDPSGNTITIFMDAAGTGISNTSPMTWAVNDNLYASGIYLI